jgi:hypothetical protein
MTASAWMQGMEGGSERGGEQAASADGQCPRGRFSAFVRARLSVRADGFLPSAGKTLSAG